MGEHRSPERFSKLSESRLRRVLYPVGTVAALLTLAHCAETIIKPALRDGQVAFEAEQQQEWLRGLDSPSVHSPDEGAGASIEELRVRGPVAVGQEYADPIAPDMGKGPHGGYVEDLRSVPQATRETPTQVAPTEGNVTEIEKIPSKRQVEGPEQ